ncbi:hypothetical protein TNCV_3171521 [Trichonephila clavipes]|nr:hypothetical protein TNCV_3171521 [Trichonephila clavipes]
METGTLVSQTGKYPQAFMIEDTVDRVCDSYCRSPYKSIGQATNDIPSCSETLLYTHVIAHGDRFDNKFGGKLQQQRTLDKSLESDSYKRLLCEKSDLLGSEYGCALFAIRQKIYLYQFLLMELFYKAFSPSLGAFS